MFRNFRTFWHVTSFTTSGHVTKDWSLSPCLIYIYRYKHNTDNVQMISHIIVHTVQMISHNIVHTVQMISHNTVHTVQMISHSTVHTVQMISYNHRQTSSAPPISDCWQLPTVPATQSTRIFHCHCNNYIEFLGDFFRKLIQILKYDLSYKSLSSVLLLLLWLIFDELICVLKYSL